jgi:hydrogenase expression/formation protein HypD
MPTEAMLNTPRGLISAIEQLVLPGPIRILNLCGDQERVITLAGMRGLMPAGVTLSSGPGCAASICPEPDLYQAVQLATQNRAVLLVSENMLQLPLGRHVFGPRTLQEARSHGADVRVVTAPMEAVLLAEAEPDREMVFFSAGFETLLAPFAGMILEGLPENLTALLCGRRAEPLIEQLLGCEDPGFEALILPGNRCAVAGTAEWEALVERFRIPAAVAGYTNTSILSAIHAVLQQIIAGQARLANCYQAMARPEGDAMARDRLFRVFNVMEGTWRGVGRVKRTAFRFRNAYNVVNADSRHPDFRGGLRQGADEMPEGCQCASVMLGQREPADCGQFAIGCSIESPYGPCMASEDGTCYLRSGERRVA